MSAENRRPLFRLAPTPSGALHLGNVLSFVLTELYAQAASGEILLRIDDLDVTRSRPEHVVSIFSVLETLGLPWQRGPRNFAEFEASYSQARRQEAYRNQFELLKLKRPQDFFVCECSRSDVQRASENGVYPGTCRNKGLQWQEGRVWRARVPEGTRVNWEDCIVGNVSVDLARVMGDFIVYRREQIFSYQWVSLCEDLSSGVSDIVRGEDLLHSSAAQLWLGSGTDFEMCRFAHHPLVTEAGRKLSKSEGAQAVEALLARPDGKARIYKAAARWCGLENASSCDSLDSLKQAFVQRKEPLRFDQNTSIDELL
jgi:glutamyl/glutaminyl-tRNA synthetase